LEILADSRNAKILAQINEQWSEWQGNINLAYDEARIRMLLMTEMWYYLQQTKSKFKKDR
tara:strand:+ start:51 stop:230 length:180 start_codon:yes stop_codon:yes gene_type:complete